MFPIPKMYNGKRMLLVIETSFSNIKIKILLGEMNDLYRKASIIVKSNANTFEMLVSKKLKGQPDGFVTPSLVPKTACSVVIDNCLRKHV